MLAVTLLSSAVMDDPTEHPLRFSMEVMEAFTESCVDVCCFHGSFLCSYFHGRLRGSDLLSWKLPQKLSRKKFDFAEDFKEAFVEASMEG